MESPRENPQQAQLILASGSKARLGLLRESGLIVKSCPVDIDEAGLRYAARDAGKRNNAIALALAHSKALGFSMNSSFMSADFVIAADQILDCDGDGFDKPRTLDEARNQLRYLRGRRHHLQTALVLYRNGKPLWEHLEAPSLTMRDFSDRFLEHYLDHEGEALLSSVGAYKLEGLGVQLFSSIEGAHDAIMGLPRLPLLKVLRHWGMVEK